jgi:iron(III) transport system ATP-binding protein
MTPIDATVAGVEIDRLNLSFGDTQVLKGINLNIEPGEFFAFLGPSGSGKSTLLRAIAGFGPTPKGRILIGGEEIAHLPPWKRNVGMVFQSYALWPHMTVRRNVAFGLEERKMEKDKIEKEVFKALSTVRMENYADRKINQLSGGQQQRVALARALVVRPQCLLLDEPLSNLDAKLRQEMRTEIRRICQQFKLTAIYVTHDQKEALSIADRMAVLEAGRISQIGTPQEIYRAPHSKSVADFIGETNFINCKLTSASEQEGHWVVETDHGQFRGRLADPTWTPREGQTATLSIRPETLTLSTENPLINTLAGKIEEATYLGEVAQYLLKTEEGTPLRISELNPTNLRETGDTLHYAVAEPHDVVILRH